MILPERAGNTGKPKGVIGGAYLIIHLLTKAAMKKAAAAKEA